MKISTRLIRKLLEKDEFAAIDHEVLDIVEQGLWKFTDGKQTLVGNITWIEDSLRNNNALPGNWHDAIADLLIYSVECTDVEYATNDWSIRNNERTPTR